MDTDKPDGFIYHLVGWAKKYWQDFIPLVVIAIIIVGVIIIFALRDSPKPVAKLAITSDNTSSSVPVTSSDNNTDVAQSSNFNVSALWDSSVHGLLAYTGMANGASDFSPKALVLINPSTGKIIAQENMPESGEFNGQKYAPSTIYGLGNTGYQGYLIGGNNNRYIALTIGKGVGYYDLETSKVYQVTIGSTSSNGATTEDSNPIFDDSTNPNLLVFTRQTNPGGFSQGVQGDTQTLAYNTTTKQVQTYSGQTTNNGEQCPTNFTFSTSANQCDLDGKGAIAGKFLAAGAENELVIDDNNPDPQADADSQEDVVPVPGYENQIMCTPIAWLDNNNVLCDQTTGNDSNLLKLDIGAGSTNQYKLYVIPAPLDILPTNTYNDLNPVISPDNTTLEFLGCSSNNTDCSLYQVAASGGQPNKIISIGNQFDNEIDLLQWR